MHVLIGVISAAAGLIWAIVAMQRAGIKLNSFNPLLWYRRSKWKNKYAEKPVYNLSEPMDVAAVLILGIAKCEGEISAEQKKTIQTIFENEFRLDPNEAADLLLASSYLIRDEIYLVDNLEKILEKSQSKFTDQQVESLLSLMSRIGNQEGALNQEQSKLVTATGNYFGRNSATQGLWN